MLKLTPPCVRVKPARAPLTLTDTPQVVNGRTARGIIRRAKFTAVFITVGRFGRADIVDVPKCRLLKALRNRDEVWLSECFGTIIAGRPEPI